MAGRLTSSVMSRKIINIIVIALVTLLVFSRVSIAVDNPDAPDYVGEFEKRIAPFEKYINEKAKTTLDYSQGYKKLEEALDKELNTAYKLLISKLNSKEKEQLKESQKQWLKFRDSEFKWISANWTNTKYGSSSVISAGAYRTTIIRERVIQLLQYLKGSS